MSSYLTITYNGVIMCCVCRSSMLYKFCHAPFGETFSDLTLDDLNYAITDAKRFIKEVDKQLCDRAWMADGLTAYEDLSELWNEMDELGSDKKKAKTALTILETLKEIYEMNTEERGTFELPDVHFEAKWRKD